LAVEQNGGSRNGQSRKVHYGGKRNSVEKALTIRDASPSGISKSLGFSCMEWFVHTKPEGTERLISNILRGKRKREKKGVSPGHWTLSEKN
jgi:hypothetical protein